MDWFIIFLIAGIFLSAYMTIRNGNSEKVEEVDEYYIEQEGNVYMERIEQEREKRKTLANGSN